MAHLAYQPGRSGRILRHYHADVLTGTYAFGAVSAALYQRAQPQGQHTTSRCGIDAEPHLNELQWSHSR